MTNAEVIAYIRVLLGGVSPSMLPDDVIILFYTRWSTFYTLTVTPEKLPLVLWNTCCDCLRYLISSTVSSGNIGTERSEKIGDESISVKGGSQLQAWKDLLQYITDNPEYVDPSLASVGLRLIVGGVRKSIVDEVKKDPESVGWNKAQDVVKYTDSSCSRDTTYIYHLGGNCYD